MSDITNTHVGKLTPEEVAALKVAQKEQIKNIATAGGMNEIALSPTPVIYEEHNGPELMSN